MPASPQVIAFVEDQLASVGPVCVRRMFGGAGVFVDGLMFALVADDVLYFKVDGQSQPVFEAEGSVPFGYQTKSGRTTIMSYWRVPERLFDEPDEIADWARAALAAAQRAAGVNRGRKKKTK